MPTYTPIEIELLKNALESVVDEMALTVVRTAYSTNIKTRQDFSCAYFDQDLRIIAQAFTQPIHLGSFVELVPSAVRSFGIDRLDPGDMLVTNDPYSGGVHLNDITVIAPVHNDGHLVGYMANLAHHVDVGGAVPGSQIVAVNDAFAFLYDCDFDLGPHSIDPDQKFTLVGLESMRALKFACMACGLSDSQVEDVFCNNARRLYGRR